MQRVLEDDERRFTLVVGDRKYECLLARVSRLLCSDNSVDDADGSEAWKVSVCALKSCQGGTRHLGLVIRCIEDESGGVL